MQCFPGRKSLDSLYLCFFVTFLTAKSEYFLAERKGICVQVLMKCSYETNFTLTVPEFLLRVVYTGDA